MKNQKSIWMIALIVLICISAVYLFFAEVPQTPVTAPSSQTMELGLLYSTACGEVSEICLYDEQDTVPNFYVYDFDLRKSFPITSDLQESVLLGKLQFSTSVLDSIKVAGFDHAWLIENLKHYTLEKFGVEYDLTCEVVQPTQIKSTPHIECTIINTTNDAEHTHQIENTIFSFVSPMLILEGPDYQVLLREVTF